ncbi:MAG: PmoA family protein, partial [Planctomycetota bacterium]
MRLIFSLVLLFLATSYVQAGEVKLLREGENVTVTIDGKLFTRYYANSVTRPVLWPLVGPEGIEMTRSFPMKKDVEGERTDHPHHRSLWFAHGDVNRIDFWTEPSDKNPKKRGFGKVVHKEYLKIQNGEDPHLLTKNEWVVSKNNVLLTDFRRVSFGADEKRRWIDFDISLFAEGDKPVKFGDTKEGCFGIRVASWLAVDAKSKGQIVNSVGKENKDAWGQASSWVDYHGERDGKKLGIAVLNHPGSFRFPTYWHVRTYGLFAANVFGLHNFKNSEDEDGSHELKPGESLMFCYRVLLHSGDEQKGRIPESFVEYAKLDKPPLTREQIMLEVQEEKEAAAIAAA